MKKIFLTAFLTILLASAANAQELGFFTRGNLSIGSKYHELDFSGDKLFYSGGGGMGLELGLQTEVATDLKISISIGHQLNLAILQDIVLDDINTSSAFFNRTFIGLGAIKGFKLSHRTVTHILLGAGVQYNTPGRLQLVENESDLGDISYNSAFSLYLEAGISLKLSESVTLDPTMRYRSLTFEADSLASNSPNLTNTDLVNYNANGVELALTLVKWF